MELNDLTKNEIKVRRDSDEHFKPYVPNAIEQMAIEGAKQHKTYGQMQAEETVRLMKKREEAEKKRKKF